MKNRIIWTVEFSAKNMDFETGCPGMSGKLFIWAKDIFDALEQAKDMIRSFGFDSFTVHKAAHDSEEEEE